MGYIGDHIGEHYKLTEGDTRSVDYSSYGGILVLGTGFRLTCLVAYGYNGPQAVTPHC